MGKLLNIDAETDANIIDDGTEPTLTITNSSGAALEVNKLVASSSATISGADLSAITKIDVATPISAAAATIAAVTVRGASVASGAALKLTGDALVSCTSIKFTTGGVAGTKALRVVLDDSTFAWIPVLPDGAVTAAAVA
jgi:hypothetical protein